MRFRCGAALRIVACLACSLPCACGDGKAIDRDDQFDVTRRVYAVKVSRTSIESALDGKRLVHAIVYAPYRAETDFSKAGVGDAALCKRLQDFSDMRDCWQLAIVDADWNLRAWLPIERGDDIGASEVTVLSRGGG